MEIDSRLFGRFNALNTYCGSNCINSFGNDRGS